MEPHEPGEDVKPAVVPAAGSSGPRGWECACRALGLVGVACFFAFAFTPLPNFIGTRLEIPSQLETAGAIVVLGAGVSEDGVLGDDSLRRAMQGILLQRRGLAPLLVLSGPAIKNGPTEAAVRGELARGLGVPSKAILTEDTARTTREEAIRIGELLRARQVRRILLVTSPYHMLRAQPLFERAGFEVHPATTEDGSRTDSSPEGRLKLMRQVLQEVLARLYYRVAGYL
ncbi:MAG TPA: YdcF family protein [Candidatus Methylomirabilis sp.]|nr:YdcF family protein [Candidatus Methylomirabilis sp.]